MRMRRATLLAVALLTVAGLTVGCGRSSLKIGWRETSGLRHKTARNSSFSGVERASFRAQADETVELDYEVEVEKGTLALSLMDPEGEPLWEETFQEDAADVLSFSAPQSGRYELRIEGSSTEGAFDVSWRVGEP
jgi:methionine-rich copper-binding protein CopC